MSRRWGALGPFLHYSWAFTPPKYARCPAPTSPPASGWKPVRTLPFDTPPPDSSVGLAPVAALDKYKCEVRNSLVKTIDVGRLNDLTPEPQRTEIQAIIGKMLESEPPPVEATDYEPFPTTLLTDRIPSAREKQTVWSGRFTANLLPSVEPDRAA